MNDPQSVTLTVFGAIVLGAGTAFGANIQYSFAPISLPGSMQTAPEDVNNLGQIVGLGDPPFSFVYSNGNFSSLTYPGGTQTEAHGINNNGKIVGEFVTAPAHFHGFLDSGGAFSAIDYPGATSTFAYGINDSGQIVGDFSDLDFEYHGFLDVGGSITALNYPGAFCIPDACGTFATGINNSGQIVGRYGDAAGVTHGFLYSNGSFTTIDYPGISCPPVTALLDCGTWPQGINNNGQIVGYYMVPVLLPNGGVLTTHGFLEDGGVFTTIDHPGSPLITFVWGINDIGQIAGYYEGAGGPKGFLGTPVPEPHSLPVFPGCLIGLFALARRKLRPCPSPSPRLPGAAPPSRHWTSPATPASLPQSPLIRVRARAQTRRARARLQPQR